MKAPVRTCLWFNKKAKEAAEFYVSLIPGSEIESLSTFEHALGPDHNDVEIVEFTLGGTPYQAMSAGPHHNFNDAMSIVVVTEDQAETDRLWDALTKNGGEPVQCGWLKDRFGVSWQVVPRQLPELVSSPDRNAAWRAIQAMLQMKKIDIEAMQRAFAGNS